MKSYFESIDIKDLELKQPEVGNVSNEITPTDEECMQVVEMLRNGDCIKDIWRNFVRIEGISKLSLSKNQIREIKKDWEVALAEKIQEKEKVEKEVVSKEK